MKIYLNNYDFKELDKSLKYDNEYYNDLFYTPDNILIRDNDDFLWNCELINDNYDTHIINNITFFIDNSKLNKIEKIYYIPRENFHMKEYIYEKEINDNLIFVKKIVYDEENYYFEYNGNKDSFSFIDLFNFINYIK